MPRVKGYEKFIPPKYSDRELIDIIYNGIRHADIKVEDFARKAGMSPTTFFTRRKNPEDFTLKELRAIRWALQLPDDEFRRALSL